MNQGKPNSAIDELMPARYRGRIDILINGSFWVGAVAGSGASLIFLDLIASTPKDTAAALKGFE